MRSRILPAVGISALALVAAAALAPGASASRGGGPAAVHHGTAGVSHASTAAACTKQRDNDNGVGIVSQNFEASFDIYDSKGADDFKIGATACKVRSVTADGAYFNGSGPAVSYNVTFYKGGTLPGAVIKTLNNRNYTDGGFGTPTIKLGRKGPKLTQGKYWLSVQANMDFSTGGEWGWNTNNTVRLNPAAWKNPGDGFGTGCTSYTTLTTCIAASEGGDFSFSLSN